MDRRLIDQLILSRAWLALGVYSTYALYCVEPKVELSLAAAVGSGFAAFSRWNRLGSLRSSVGCATAMLRCAVLA